MKKPTHFLRATPTPRVRKGFIQRRTPIRRGKPPRRVSSKRREQNKQYSGDRVLYLIEHPLCQIYIAEHGINEADAVAAFRDQGGVAGPACFGSPFAAISRTSFNGHKIPIATQIHHRNKTRGERKLDERFWMSASPKMHNEVEDRKQWARDRGLLLPFNADADGRMPDGIRWMTTPEMIEFRAGLAAAGELEPWLPPVVKT